MSKRRAQAFTLIELLVVIAIIALLMGILIPALSAAKKLASGAACLANQRSLSIAWVTYADDNDGLVMCNGACYDTATDRSPWVHRPKDIAGNSLPSPAPASITNEDRYRGIMAGTMWPYVKDVDVYHCPGDNRRSTRQRRETAFAAIRSPTLSAPFRIVAEMTGGGGSITTSCPRLPTRRVTTCSSKKSTTAAATARTKGAGTCPLTAMPIA